MKIIKNNEEIMIIKKEYENVELLNCNRIICNLGSFGPWDCTYCPFKNGRKVNIDKLNIIEVEI